MKKDNRGVVRAACWHACNVARAKKLSHVKKLYHVYCPLNLIG